MQEEPTKIAEKKFRPSVPGERRGGRQKGTPNKSTALLKDAILTAATEAGGEGGMAAYLKLQATLNPGPFMSLLGKVLPMQITGEDGGAVLIERIERVVLDPK